MSWIHNVYAIQLVIFGKDEEDRYEARLMFQRDTVLILGTPILNFS